ncbi:LytTR family DNA-binding domain-containing protein [Qipengyuania sp. JC766]|uniref:LytTR family DNA-binding domain-containing protein n=1 Tax=Qipengyuania sp. JC766 TaxID=3232139 RepID=UPI00345A0F56
MQPGTERMGDGRGARLARQIIIDVCVLIAIGALLGFLGPLGTGSMGLAGRMAYWIAMALAGYAFYRPIGAIVVGLGPKLDLPPWFLWGAAVAIATVPMSVLVWHVNTWRGDSAVVTLEVALAQYVSVLVVGAIVTTVFHLLPATREETGDAAPAETRVPLPESSPAQPPSERPRFLDRLPPRLGSDLLALEMEDHYVRAHTALGSELVLIRMRDAVAELDGIAGEQVHRSWWVARDAVEDVKRDGRNVRLVLANGIDAPVSRARVSELRDRGWI